MSRLSPVNQARWARFRHNRRGYWSLWIFLVLFGLSLCSELIANDKPLLVRYASFAAAFRRQKVLQNASCQRMPIESDCQLITTL
ncbi:hypothetical protein NE615_25595, partial [Escherichia coli]|nr:hypothetical protein [Escherichia coli]